QAVGKSRSHIANMLRLLNLPQPVKDMVQSGALSAGHARALVNAPNPSQLADQVARKGLNVRQTERLAQSGKSTRGRKPSPPKVADTLAIEREMTNLLGLRVSITFRRRGGELVIHYKTLDQLNEVLRRMSQSPPRA
ncbi:MAG: ParB/RepB/Spo0J family partition protein, partial [Rhodospirillales bacterium]